MNVAKVDGPIRTPRNTESFRRERRVRGKRPKAANIGVDGAERHRSRLCDKGLSRDSLGGLGSSLLRLGNIRATILAIVDPLSSPRGFCGKCVDDLKKIRPFFQHTTTRCIIPLWR